MQTIIEIQITGIITLITNIVKIILLHQQDGGKYYIAIIAALSSIKRIVLCTNE